MTKKLLIDLLQSLYVSKESDKQKITNGFKKNRNAKNHISLTTTVEALLILSTEYGYGFYNKKVLDCFNFKNIKNYLLGRFELIFKEASIRRGTIDVANCALGLHLLGEHTKAREIYQEYLEKSKCLWGEYLDSDDDELDFYSTYIVMRFAVRSRQNASFSTPEVIKKIATQHHKDIGLYCNKQNTYKCTELLVLVMYMYRYYFGEDNISSSNLKGINKHFQSTEYLNSITAPNSNAYNYLNNLNNKIFVFGMAAALVYDLNKPFFLHNSAYITTRLDHNAILNYNYCVPFILEILHLKRAIINTIDVFSGNGVTHQKPSDIIKLSFSILIVFVFFSMIAALILFILFTFINLFIEHVSQPFTALITLLGFLIGGGLSLYLTLSKKVIHLANKTVKKFLDKN